MTKINSEDVRKVAKLARMHIPEDEIEMYTNQLEKILGYVAQLESVDTDQTLPTTRAVEVTNVMRDDLVNATNIREELLNQAPQRSGDFFRVPKILSD